MSTIPFSYECRENSCVERSKQSGTLHVNVICNRGSIFALNCSCVAATSSASTTTSGEDAAASYSSTSTLLEDGSAASPCGGLPVSGDEVVDSGRFHGSKRFARDASENWRWACRKEVLGFTSLRADAAR